MNDFAIQSAIRIILADDHTMVVSGMISIISSYEKCEVIATTSTGQETIEQYQQLLPDILIVDIELPDFSGLEVIERLMKMNPIPKIIVLSAHNKEEVIYQAIQLGAMAYILKESMVDELYNVITRVYRGEKVFSSDITDAYIRRSTKPSLSQRESEVLKLVSEGNSNAIIAELLYISEGTVKIHVHNILKKMNVSDRTAAVVEAIKLGIVQI